MRKLFTCGAAASIFLLTAGPAALAQNYNPNYGPGGGQGWNQSSNQGWNQGGYSGGNQGWNQGGWGQGSGSSQPAGPQQSAMQDHDANGPTAQDAWQELSKYGYKNIGGMERSEGWQARATKNGERVFVFIDDDGMIATYRGDGQGQGQ